MSLLLGVPDDIDSRINSDGQIDSSRLILAIEDLSSAVPSAVRVCGGSVRLDY